MSELNTKRFIKSIGDIVDKRVIDHMGSVVRTKPGIIHAISTDGLRVAVQLLEPDVTGQPMVIGVPVETDGIQNYNTRKVEVGDPCFLVHWGDGGKRMNNCCLLLGGDEFKASADFQYVTPAMLQDFLNGVTQMEPGIKYVVTP